MYGLDFENGEKELDPTNARATGEDRMICADPKRSSVDHHHHHHHCPSSIGIANTAAETPTAVIPASSSTSTNYSTIQGDNSKLVCAAQVPSIARYLVERKEFDAVMNIAVIINGILAGLSTYQSLRSTMALRCAEYAVLAIFTVDIFLRILVEPWTYWLPHKSRGSFDLLITILFYLPFDEKSRLSVSLLSMLRLVSFLKIISFTPQLRIIVMGMVGGFTAVGYIMFLLLFIYYIYAIVGMSIFQQNNQWYFGDLPTAILTLFRASTLDSWSDIFYIDFYGCQNYNAGIYRTKQSNATLLNDDGSRDMCIHPKEQPILATLYWISFVIVASFVVMSLFVGSITMSMTESMRQLKREKEEQRVRVLREKKVKALLSDFSISNRRLTFIEPKRLSFAERLTRFLGLEMTLSEKIAARTKLAHILQQCLKAQEVVVLDTNPVQQSDHLSFSLSHIYEYTSKVCAKLTASSYFDWFIYCNIILTGIVISIKVDQKNTLSYALKNLESALIAIFTVEIVFKVVAEGSYPLRFVKSIWNCIDLFIVLGCFFARDNGWKSTLETLRLLRLLKMTRGFKSLTKFQVIMNALFSGLSSIFVIGLLLLIVVFIYSVLGVFLFGANDPKHFESLHISSISLFRCATMDSWSTIMYINMYGCDKYGYEDNLDLCTSPRARGVVAVAYFVSYTVLSSLVLLTLFIGVVTTTMEDAQEKQRQYENMEDKIIKFQADYNIAMDEIDRYREAFHILDLNESGNIDMDELRICLKAIGQDPPDMQLYAMMKAVSSENLGSFYHSSYTLSRIYFSAFIYQGRHRRQW